MAQQSYLEDVVEEATKWLEEMPQLIADLLKVNGRSPFGAPATEAEKLAYYRTQFFNPDGTPNQPGRQAELQRLGIDGYVAVLRALTKNAADQVQLRATQEPGGPPNVYESLKEQS